jgi:peptidoglycan hydrolase CwlO-like protein
MISGGSGNEIERQVSSSSITSVQTTGRYEEAAYHRHELEAVKRENEALKRKIRELERTIRERRQSDASRPRSESVSTTASVSNRDSMGVLARSREVDREDESQEEVVRVGESARSGGLR